MMAADHAARGQATGAPVLALALVPAIAAEARKARLRTIAPEHTEAAMLTYPMTSIATITAQRTPGSFAAPRANGPESAGDWPSVTRSGRWRD